MNLCEITSRISRWTWNRLREARNHGFQLGEESITDFLLLKMKKEGKGQIIVESFTRHEEATNGSDWECWIKGTSGQWLGMRIQAKVLNLKSEKYEQLHHSNRHGQQVDLLIEDAKKNGLVPLYCMYSNWNPIAYKTKSNCCTSINSVRHYGTALLNPDKVKTHAKTKGNHLRDFIADLKPMHCLFCCSGYSSGGLSETALDWLKQNGMLPKDVQHTKEETVNHYLKESPTEYVLQLLRGEFQNNPFDLADKRLKRIIVIKENNSAIS